MQANFPYALPQVTIPNGQAISNSVQIGSGVLVGLIVPAAWTAAEISFLASVDGVNFFPLYDGTGNNPIAIETPVAGSYVTFGYETNIKFDSFRSVLYLEVVSGVPGANVNQGAARTIQLVVDKSLMGTI